MLEDGRLECHVGLHIVSNIQKYNVGLRFMKLVQGGCATSLLVYELSELCCLLHAVSSL